VLKVATRVVARASNRVFVGEPLCRNLSYLEICINFTRDLLVARLLLGRFPKLLKPCVWVSACNWFTDGNAGLLLRT
jgi:hypothetical protein